MTTVIADSTPLIYLAAIGKFELLRDLYVRIVVPCAVYDEVATQGAGRPGAAETAGALWIDRVAVSDPSKATSLLTHLDNGESEAIVLAEGLHADLVIMDESAGRPARTGRPKDRVSGHGRGADAGEAEGPDCRLETGIGPASCLRISSHRPRLPSLPGSQRGINATRIVRLRGPSLDGLRRRRLLAAFVGLF